MATVYYRTKNKYDLNESFYDNALSTVSTMFSTLTNLLDPELFTKITGQFVGLYKQKDSNNVVKDQSMFDFLLSSDDKKYASDKDRILLIVIALCFLAVLFLNKN